MGAPSQGLRPMIFISYLFIICLSVCLFVYFVYLTRVEVTVMLCLFNNVVFDYYTLFYFLVTLYYFIITHIV
jgi:hypothetical protein